MGEIRKQAVAGTVYTYLGTGLGFFIQGVLFTNFLRTDQVGLINILVAYSMLFAQFASLGFIATTTKLFPYFKSEKERHNGFLFILMVVTIVGAMVSYIGFCILRPILIQSEIDDIPLFIEFINYIIPLYISTLFFNALDHYSKVLFKATRGLFLKEVLQRIFTLLSLLLLCFNWIDFTQFLILYVIGNLVPTVLIIILLIKDKQFNLSPKMGFLDSTMVKTMASVSIFGLIASASGPITQSLDRIMIANMMGEGGLESAGIYSIAFMIAGLVATPSRALLKISAPFISDAWKRNAYDEISTIYSKTSLIQLIVGAFLFGGILINLDSVFLITSDKWAGGYWVIIIVGFSFLADMATGISAHILVNSPKYRIYVLFLIITSVLFILMNYIFISLYGVIGTAFAVLLSKLFHNLGRFVYIWHKFKMQPYDFKFLLVVIFALLAYFIAWIIPKTEYFIITIFIHSIVFTIAFFVPTIYFKISSDLNDRFFIYMTKAKNIFLKIRKTIFSGRN